MKKTLIAILVVISACQQEDILTPLSESQVVRLLTDGGTKTWLITELVVDGERKTFSTCNDTIRWVFQKVNSDSIVGFELKFDANCILYDTVFMGKLSIYDVNESFPDSLNFNGGSKSFVQPLLLRSGALMVSYSGLGNDTIATFTKTRSEILSRQVGNYLTNGIEPGDSLEWAITSLTKNKLRQQLVTCSDSVKYIFFRSDQGEIQWNQLTPINECTDFTTEFFGTFTVSGDGGFFNYSLVGTGGLVSELTITSFAPKVFSGTYFIGQDFYSFTCKAKRESKKIYSFSDLEEYPIDMVTVFEDWESSGWKVHKDTIEGTDINYSISKDAITFPTTTLKCEIIGGDKNNSVGFTNEIAKNPKQSNWFFEETRILSYSIQIYPEVTIDCEKMDLSEVDGLEFVAQHTVIPYSWKWAFQWSKANVWSYWNDTQVNGVQVGWVRLPNITDCIEMNSWNTISFIGRMDNTKIYYDRLVINENTYPLTKSFMRVLTPVEWDENFLSVGFKINGDSAIRMDHSEGVDPVTIFLNKVSLDVFD